MDLIITHGLHPNEYTSHTVQETGRILFEAGHEIFIGQVPIQKTGWGVALRGGTPKEVGDAFCFLEFLPRTDADFLFEFHTTREEKMNPLSRLAEELRFGSLGLLDFNEVIKMELLRWDM